MLLRESRIAALDLGSSTFKAVLGEIRDGRIATRLLDKRLVRLGKVVADNGGIIDDATLAQARRAIAELKSICEREGSNRILAVATQAVGAARNGSAVVDAANALGLTLEVATAEREAELGYLAVTRGRKDKLVCELGSHSMQIAWRQSASIESIAIPAGYERVYPELIRNAGDFARARDAYSEFLHRELQRLPVECDELIGMAMNTMACFVTGKQKAQVTERHLSRARIRGKVRALSALSGTEFSSLKAATPKADKILSGLILLDHMLERTGLERAFIAESELPVGLIVEYFGNALDC